MKQKTATNNLKITLVILTIATLLSFLAISYSLSKYTASQEADYTVSSHDFYFNSNFDVLKPVGTEFEFLTAFNFELYNFVGDDIATYEINYDIDIDITQSSDANAKVTVEDDKEGKLTANSKTTALITITPDADVAKFTITVSTTNGYGATLSLMCSRQAFTIAYNLGGGINDPDNPTQYTADSDAITIGSPIRSGWLFDGWYSDAPLTTPANTTIASGSTGNKNYYAKWAAYRRINQDGTTNNNGNYVLFGDYPQTEKAAEVTITSTQDDRGYYLGNDKYFYLYAYNKYYKVEPIKWRILNRDYSLPDFDTFEDEEGYDQSYYFNRLLCETILINRPYSANNDNNYANSDIRYWLNGYYGFEGSDNFISKAFDTGILKHIRDAYIDNSIASTGTDSNSFACNDTKDRIFLPSTKDLSEAFGDFDYFNNSDELRKRDYTDYSYNSKDFLYQYWLTRSPDRDFSHSVQHVNEWGSGWVSGANQVAGVVPMLSIYFTAPP